MKANIGDRSRPPMGGITPLNTFKYGSVIEYRLEMIGLLESRLGNHVNKILIISKKLYICIVCMSTSLIRRTILVFNNFLYFMLLFHLLLDLVLVRQKMFDEIFQKE